MTINVNGLLIRVSLASVSTHFCVFVFSPVKFVHISAAKLVTRRMRDTLTADRASTPVLVTELALFGDLTSALSSFCTIQGQGHPWLEAV